MARKSLSDIMASAPDIDPARLDATTDEDIQSYKAAEGFPRDYRPDGSITSVPAVSDLRQRLGMTQDAFARFLRIPVATIRNWEQGRKIPDPAARTLLAIVAADPARAVVLLGDKTATEAESKLSIFGTVHLETTRELTFNANPLFGLASAERVQMLIKTNKRVN